METGLLASLVGPKTVSNAIEKEVDCSGDCISDPSGLVFIEKVVPQRERSLVTVIAVGEHHFGPFNFLMRVPPPQ
jgi:hypothetical protein